MSQEDRVVRQLYVIFESLPNPFAQLAFLEFLRDRYTRRYVHDAWAGISSAEEVDLALRNIHRQIFRSVAGMPLMDLSRHLRKYFQSLAQPELRTATLWLETKPYMEMIPDGGSPLWKKLFISQVRCALEVLSRAPAWGYLDEPADPSASWERPASPEPQVSTTPIHPIVPAPPGKWLN